jgi:hypothetical protein
MIIRTIAGHDQPASCLAMTIDLSDHEAIRQCAR